MNEAHFVYGLDRQDTFGHVEPSNVFRESVILDEHRLGRISVWT
jgi:hypothetical protein